MHKKFGLSILFAFTLVVGFGGTSALAEVTAKLTTARKQQRIISILVRPTVTTSVKNERTVQHTAIAFGRFR